MEALVRCLLRGFFERLFRLYLAQHRSFIDVRFAESAARCGNLSARSTGASRRPQAAVDRTEIFAHGPHLVALAIRELKVFVLPFFHGSNHDVCHARTIVLRHSTSNPTILEHTVTFAIY